MMSSTPTTTEVVLRVLQGSAANPSSPIDVSGISREALEAVMGVFVSMEDDTLTTIIAAGAEEGNGGDVVNMQQHRLLLSLLQLPPTATATTLALKVLVTMGTTSEQQSCPSLHPTVISILITAMGVLLRTGSWEGQDCVALLYDACSNHHAWNVEDVFAHPTLQALCDVATSHAPSSYTGVFGQDCLDFMLANGGGDDGGVALVLVGIAGLVLGRGTPLLELSVANLLSRAEKGSGSAILLATIASQLTNFVARSLASPSTTSSNALLGRLSLVTVCIYSLPQSRGLIQEVVGSPDVEKHRHVVFTLRSALEAVVDARDVAAYLVAIVHIISADHHHLPSDGSQSLCCIGVRRCLDKLVQDNTPLFKAAAQLLTAHGAQDTVCSLRTFLSQQPHQAPTPQQSSLSSSVSSSSPKLKINISAFK